MDEQFEQEQAPAEYLPPMLVEVGQFSEDTLGGAVLGLDQFSLLTS